MADRAQGFYVDAAHRVCVGFPDRTIVFGLTADELRALAAALNQAADAMESEAGDAASAALGRAAGRLN